MSTLLIKEDGKPYNTNLPERFKSSEFIAFYNRLPEKVICSKDKTQIKTYHIPKDKIQYYPYILINREDPKSRAYTEQLVRIDYLDIDIDVDYRYWFEIRPKDYKVFPTIISINPENNHFHGLLQIRDSMPYWCANNKSKNLLNYVTNGLKMVLDADLIITTQNLLVKNPLNLKWNSAGVANRIYTLTEIKNYINEYKLDIKNNLFRTTAVSTKGSLDQKLFDIASNRAYRSVIRFNSIDSLIEDIFNYLRFIFSLDDNDLPESSISDKAIRSKAERVSIWTFPYRDDFIKRYNRNTGILGLDSLDTKDKTKEEILLEIKNRQSEGAKYTNELRKSKTKDKIDMAIKDYMLNNSTKLTLKELSNITGLSYNTIRKHKTYISNKIIPTTNNNNDY